MCWITGARSQKTTGLFCSKKKEDEMKLIAVVLIVRLFLQLISNKNEEDNKNDVNVQEKVKHPAAHQLR
jgi:hypothetical protein